MRNRFHVNVIIRVESNLNAIVLVIFEYSAQDEHEPNDFSIFYGRSQPQGG